jgi:hypothetical protein
MTTSHLRCLPHFRALLTIPHGLFLLVVADNTLRPLPTVNYPASSSVGQVSPNNPLRNKPSQKMFDAKKSKQLSFYQLLNKIIYNIFV